ncbi:MAG: glycosyltransferase [Candidatus Methanoplasma sp.]|jgi:cellulose synthase/poly-beta-1,6-N-acetylglucosamine synthase-like glycosyltransferase|nr:glycosyltransferase [Candidatus Methanoplasma sp.]
MNTISVTVGICAYNEVANIERAVRSVFEQDRDGFVLEEVIVVSSGSTDGTDDVVESLTQEYPELRLIRQEKREGKNSALNCVLDNKNTEVVVILNADNVFGSNESLKKLVHPFEDDKVGIVGGRPIPTNSTDTVAGFASNVIWVMHHYVSLQSPKIGELIAFRDIGTRLSLKSQSDEDLLKMNLEKEGYVSVYVPEATVYNRGPETIKDYIKQRTRVNIGECYVKRDHDFDIPTWNFRQLYSALTKTVRDMGFHPFKITISVVLEIYSRMKASVHVKMDKGDMNVWEQVETTKKL